MRGDYLKRYAFPACLPIPPADSRPHMVVVVPSYDEPSLEACLKSLHNCCPSNFPVDVIVVINFPEQVSDEERRRHYFQYEEIQKWAKDHSTDLLRFCLIYAPDLPTKTAGVGVARKTGMDDAIRRLPDDGIVVCLDADCTVSGNYLRAIEDHFQKYPNSPGCSIYFEHPMEEVSGVQNNGINHYELFLRYYVQALRLCGFPYSYHTVGSSMAVRAWAYMKQGGMNRRKAGEDFYFLSRIFPLGNFSELTTAAVIPSSRKSQRVPFGTGRAMLEWEDKQKLDVYPLELFDELRSFFSSLKGLYEEEDPTLALKGLGNAMWEYLNRNTFTTELARIKKGSKTYDVFRKHFFDWFDGARVMKFLNFACLDYYKKAPICNEANKLLKKRGLLTDQQNVRPLLELYRAIDRKGGLE